MRGVTVEVECDGRRGGKRGGKKDEKKGVGRAEIVGGRARVARENGRGWRKKLALIHVMRADRYIMQHVHLSSRDIHSPDTCM